MTVRSAARTRHLTALAVLLCLAVLSAGLVHPQRADAAAATFSCMPANGLMNMNPPDDLMAGRLVLPVGTIQIGTTGVVEWNRPTLDTSNARLFLSLKWLESLTRAYTQTGKKAYLDRAVAIASDFAKVNPPGGGPDPADAWSAMYAGQRTTTYACLDSLRPSTSALVSALSGHGSWLAAPANHPGNWNQGIDAALGLLASGCRLGRTDWQTTARDRFGSAISVSIDAQGALNEQAPGYGQYVYERWGLVEVKLKECGVAALSLIAERRPRLLDFLAWSTQPDGLYAQIGDSFVVPPPSVPGTTSLYAASLGTKGVAGTGTHRTYSSGYAFGRSTWNPYTSGSHYSLRFGPARDFHGHWDHHSVTLAALGRPVLVEAGHSGYSNATARAFQRSPEGHNVMTLPGERFTGSATALVRQTLQSAWQWHETSDTGYGRTRLRGTYVDLSLPLMVVQDRASRSTSGAFDQLWHLPQGSKVTIGGRSRATALSADGKVQTTIVQVPLPGQSLDAGATSVVTGRTSPMQGWVSRKADELVAAPVVVARRSGTSTRAVTVVVPSAPGVSVSTSIATTSNGWALTIGVGSHKRVVGLSSGGGMWAASPTTLPEPLPTCTIGSDDCPVDRLAGTDRYATAVAIGAAASPKGSTVVLASGEQSNLVDGLVAAPLARRLGAPVLLSTRDSVPSVVLDDLKRRKATRALLVGGEGALSRNVVAALERRGLTVERISGTDRYETARVVAKRLRTENGRELPGAFLASGANPNLVDALGAGGAAAHATRAIVLTRPDVLSPAAAAALTEVRSSSKAPVDVVGGTGAVSAAVESAVRNAGHPVRRLSGSDRYATAGAVAVAYVSAADADGTVVVSSGANANLVDALPGGALARPVVLTARDQLPEVSRTFAQRTSITRALVLGGTGAVGQPVVDSLGQALK